MNGGPSGKRPSATRVRLLRQAARRYRALFPDLVRIAYGPEPDPLQEPSGSHPQAVRNRAQARAELIRDGYLSATELESLPLAEATETALRRLRQRLPIIASVERETRR